MVTAMTHLLRWLAVCIGTVGLLMIFVACCYLMLCLVNSLRQSWTRSFGASHESRSSLHPEGACNPGCTTHRVLPKLTLRTFANDIGGIQRRKLGNRHLEFQDRV
jgi:hypothetical protein